MKTLAQRNHRQQTSNETSWCENVSVVWKCTFSLFGPTKPPKTDFGPTKPPKTDTQWNSSFCFIWCLFSLKMRHKTWISVKKTEKNRRPTKPPKTFARRKHRKDQTPDETGWCESFNLAWNAFRSKCISTHYGIKAQFWCGNEYSVLFGALS